MYERNDNGYLWTDNNTCLMFTYLFLLILSITIL